jgi:iron complex transport system ATP-binding protein
VILSVKGIHFSYNSVNILKNVSFEMNPGQILGVLGVNGAGKSTLLKCLNRILRPQMGTVLLSETEILSLKRNEIAKRIGYVPQRYDQESLTIFDAVLLGRKPHMKWGPTSHDISVVENVLQVMGLAEHSLRPVKTLSGGQAQKVVIARALAQEPDVLLLDEPTSNLDVRNQLEVMGLVTEAVKHRGVCAMIAIHDLNLALRFADTVLFLKQGQVYAIENRESITPEVIQEVYGVTALIKEVAGHSVVVPLHCCTHHEIEGVA